MNGQWIVRLVEAAEIDYLDIIGRSAHDFGALQAQRYAENLDLTVASLGDDGTATIGVKARTEIGAGIFTLHAAKLGHKASHFLVFRLVDSNIIEVLRILHERMDLARHAAWSEGPPNH